MSTNQHHMLANIIRYLLKETTDFGAARTPVVPVKDSNIRDPLNAATENEALQFKFDMSRQPKRRQAAGTWIVGYEIHCWSKRAEDRADGLTDRHIVLASEVQEHFQELDLTIRDAVGGNTNTILGVLQTDDSTVHYRDKRNTIFGTSVDYSLETPTSLQAVVVVSGLLIK